MQINRCTCDMFVSEIGKWLISYAAVYKYRPLVGIACVCSRDVYRYKYRNETPGQADWYKRTHPEIVLHRRRCLAGEVRPIVLVCSDIFKPFRGSGTVDKIKKYRRDYLGNVYSPWL